MKLGKEEIRKSNSKSMKNLYKPCKQLYFDMDTDKYYLKYIDNPKLFESNIFAIKKAQINVSQTGFAKYNDRIVSNTIDKLDFKIDDSLYHPQSLRFEGYSQFPRPLAIPFSNISKIKLQKNLIKDLRKTKNIFTTTKNKNILNKKTNTGLEFYSGTINNIVNIKNKKNILNKINEFLSSDDKEKFLTKKDKNKGNEKIALKRLKNKILSNSTNIIFGRKLKKPDDKFITQFKINYNVYFKNPLKKNQIKNEKTDIENKKFFEDFYTTFNKKKVQEILNKPKIKLFIDLDNSSSNTQKKSRNINCSKIKTTLYSEEKIISNFDGLNLEKRKKSENQTDNKSIKEIKTKNIKNYLDSLYLEKNNKFKELECKSKIKYKELIPEEKEQNKNNFSQEKKVDNNFLNIKTLSDLKQDCKIEKQLLIGFIKPNIKEAIYRKTVPKYKSALNIYKKEWELIKKVNPIKYQLDEEKEMKEIQLIKEKLEKGKDIISFNLSKKRKNKFFATSNILSSQSSKEKIL